MDDRDVGVVQRRSRLGFANEPFLGFVVGAELGRKEFDGDVAVEPDVLGLVDDAHAAFAKLGDDLVVGYGLADHALPPNQPNGI
jgi:hypothetical protein